MNWQDILLALPRGLKAAAGAVASPFTADKTYAYEFGNDPAGEMGTGKGKGTLSEILDILAGVGKTTGRVGNTVGRMLPIVGPYYQGAEYGVLKGLGKEDSDWAGGNIFAEAEKRREEQEAERQQNAWKREAEKEQFGWDRSKSEFDISQQPLKAKANEQDVELGGLQIGNEKMRSQELQTKLDDINAQIAAEESMFGGRSGYKLELLKREKELYEKQLAREEAMTKSYSSLADYRDTRADTTGLMTDKDKSLILDRIKDNARQEANAAVPEIMRFQPQGREAWQKAYENAYNKGLQDFPAMGGATMNDPASDPNTNPNDTVVWFRSQIDEAKGLPEYQGKSDAQIAQAVFDSMIADGSMSWLTESELDLLKSIYGVMPTDSIPGVR